MPELAKKSQKSIQTKETLTEQPLWLQAYLCDDADRTSILQKNTSNSSTEPILADELLVVYDILMTHNGFGKILPISIYDIELMSVNNETSDMLSRRKGKVTLIFNVAAGCGNIPQHSVIEELNQKYKDEDDFSILAVVVDDFTCHGYPEFQNGIKSYIEENSLEMTPGQVAEKYAVDHFGVTYEFSELTNGRYDKHRYDKSFVPGLVKEQEQHTLWHYLTGAYEAEINPMNGLPYHAEEVPWSEVEPIDIEDKKTFPPLRGNFEKFLIDRTGTRVKRYANGFLLGERDQIGATFPWVKEKYQDNGKRDWNPVVTPQENQDKTPKGQKSSWPTKEQRNGIEFSLKSISEDIDEYLGK
jgi:glutathione peroxidase-family protein